MKYTAIEAKAMGIAFPSIKPTALLVTVDGFPREEEHHDDGVESGRHLDGQRNDVHFQVLLDGNPTNCRPI